MLATKNLLSVLLWLAALITITAGLTGCTPAGPRALLDGERLIKDHKYPEAIRRLETAARLLPANPQAWNHLGLAYHKAGQLGEAAKAYEQARRLDPNLTVARYNLGCLLLEQDNPQAAIAELTAYTVLQRDSADGWLKLARAQLRARQWDGAERSLQNAVRLAPNSAEAWNSLGVIHSQRKRPKEALTCFTQALQKRPNYAPAALNVAILNHHYLNNRPVALQKYQEYLALTPKPHDAAAVGDVVRQLRAELTPPPRHDGPDLAGAAVAAVTPPVGAAPPAARPQTNAIAARPPVESLPPQIAPPAARPKPATNLLAAANELKPAAGSGGDQPKSINTTQPQKPSPPSPPAREPLTTSQAPAASKPEVVQLNDEPPPKPAADFNVAGGPSKPADPGPAVSEPLRDGQAESLPADPLRPRVDLGDSRDKKTVVERLNPANWFKGRRRNAPGPTPLETDANEISPAAQEVRNSAISPQPAVRQTDWTGRRYRYQSPARPSPGDRRKAESYFAQAVQAHRDRRLVEAMTNYRQAIQLDPGFFEAHYNLGLAAYELKDLPDSLSAYETALSINPTSANARYNFGLALEAAGYYQDAANEFERLLEQHPNEARCHFSLASLYAERLEKPELARPHYRRVLELEPAHPKAGAIRYWLAANP